MNSDSDAEVNTLEHRLQWSGTSNVANRHVCTLRTNFYLSAKVQNRNLIHSMYQVAVVPYFITAPYARSLYGML